jgi:Zinc finger, C3HC4 type (RING finger)
MRARGRCHICEQTLEVDYCDLCDHWFCEGCRRRWFSRGVSAVKALIGWPRENCCGPVVAGVS